MFLPCAPLHHHHHHHQVGFSMNAGNFFIYFFNLFATGIGIGALMRYAVTPPIGAPIGPLWGSGRADVCVRMCVYERERERKCGMPINCVCKTCVFNMCV